MGKKKAESAVEEVGNMPLNEKNQKETKKAKTTEKNGESPAKKAKVAEPTNEGEENQPNVAQKKVRKIKKEDNAEVPAKKAKLTEPKQEKEEEEKETKPEKKKKVGINKDIFEIFNKLNDKKEKQTGKRVNQMIALLNGEEDADKRTATCAYALKRLVRCTGADDKDAVASSVSYMLAILNEVEELQPLELLRLVKVELPVGPQSKSKDDTLAAVGQMMTALSIIRSQYMEEPSVELIETIYPMLVEHLKGREYIMSLCADIIAESLQLVDQKLFQAHIWPILKAALNKPLAELKLQGCNLLLAVHLNYPRLLKLNLMEKILWPNGANYEELFDVYMSNTTIQAQNTYEYLGHFLANGTGQELNEWLQHLLKHLPLKRIYSKAYFIQTLAFILIHYQGEMEPLQNLFAESSLVSLLLQELAAAKQLNSKQNKQQSEEQAKIKASKLELVQICHHFESSLLISFQHHLDEELKLDILKALLEKQPQLDIILQTPHLVRLLIATIDDNSRRAIYKLYASHFTHTNVEEEGEQLQVTKADREQCLTQMHSMLQLYPNLMKRNKIDFLLKASLFHLNPEKQPCPAADAAEFSRQAASRCEEILLSCLVHKTGSGRDQLASLVGLLRRTMAPLVEQLKEDNIESKLRIKQTPELRQAWKQVTKVLQAEPAEEDAPALPLVFDALILFLGLASLAPSCSITGDLINDLVICKQNALKLQKKNKKKSKKASVEEEPELPWEDVLTNVLIQLMLQTGSYWRDFVKAVGGAVMPQLGINNLEQFLDVLDMNKNPLSKKQPGEDEDEDDEEEQEEETSSEEDDSDEDDSDEEDDGDEDEATQLELIREKVRVALSKDEDDDANNDASSVDWNDVDEAEGERLNMALESAFQAFKPKGGKSKGGKPKQQTKSERIDSTALLHFRIRILDLVELFVRSQPKMEAMVDAIVSVYEVCKVASTDTKMKALMDASKKLLLLLLQTKIDYGTDPNPDKTVILEAIKQFISQETKEGDNNDNVEQLPNKKKGEKQQPQQQRKVSAPVAEVRNKCVAYLIGQFNTPNMTKSKVWPELENYLKEWVSHRKSPYTLGSFDALFEGNWIGIPYLTQSFVNLLLDDTTRNLRRSQILELLDKNCTRIANVLANYKKIAKKIQASLEQYKPFKPRDCKIYTKLLANMFSTEDEEDE